MYMECPFCNENDNAVIDSRLMKEGTAIRRRRRCLVCTGRFTTYESTEDQLLLLLLKRHAHQRLKKEGSQVLLTFVSKAFRGLSGEMMKLLDNDKQPEKVVAEKRTPKRKVKAKQKRRAPARIPTARKALKLTATEEVVKIIKSHKKGLDISTLKIKTGFPDSKIRSIVYRASKQGTIKRIGHGVYVAA